MVKIAVSSKRRKSFAEMELFCYGCAHIEKEKESKLFPSTQLLKEI